MRRRQMFAMQSAGQQVAHSMPVPPPILMPIAPNPAACPKCGKVIGQGRYMHVKYCKG